MEVRDSGTDYQLPPHWLSLHLAHAQKTLQQGSGDKKRSPARNGEVERSRQNSGAQTVGKAVGLMTLDGLARTGHRARPER